jgi:hypothetical protein
MAGRAKVVPERTPAPTTIRVVIFEGDPVVGRALALLLRTCGYGVRYANRRSLEELRTFREIQLWLLAPGWDYASREIAIEMAGSMPAEGKGSVLEIGLPCDGSSIRAECYVPWPCRTESLKQRIDTALLGEPKTKDNAHAL